MYFTVFLNKDDDHHHHRLRKGEEGGGGGAYSKEALIRRFTVTIQFFKIKTGLENRVRYVVGCVINNLKAVYCLQTSGLITLLTQLHKPFKHT